MDGIGNIQDSFLWESEGWAFSNSDIAGAEISAAGKKGADDSNAVILIPPSPPSKPDDAVILIPPSPPSKPDDAVILIPPSPPCKPDDNVILIPPSPPSKPDDAVILIPSSPPSKPDDAEPSAVGKKRAAPSGNNGREAPPGLDGHVWTERERRKKMRNMFCALQSFLPHLQAKVDKTTIVDEAVNYIQTLEQTLKSLEKQKKERLQSLLINSIANSGMGSREVFLANLPAADANKTTSDLTTTSLQKFPAVFKTWTSPNISVNVSGHDAHISVCYPAKHGILFTICLVLDKFNIQVLSAHVSSDHRKSMYMIHARVGTGYEGELAAEEIYKQAAGEIMVILG